RQAAGGGQPSRRPADGGDRPAPRGTPPDQAEPGSQGAAPGGQATPVRAETAAPIQGRLAAVGCAGPGATGVRCLRRSQHDCRPLFAPVPGRLPSVVCAVPGWLALSLAPPTGPGACPATRQP